MIPPTFHNAILQLKWEHWLPLQTQTLVKRIWEVEARPEDLGDKEREEGKRETKLSYSLTPTE